MPTFYIVSKVLILKILLASIAAVNTYEYGYHPSAEEFDNLMRETRKTWTRNLIANERRRSWTNQHSNRRVSEEFYNYVPKYRNEKQKNRLGWSTDDPNVPEQLGYAQKVHDRNDHQSVSDIGSSFTFSMFSDEVLPSAPNRKIFIQQPTRLPRPTTSAHILSNQDFVLTTRPTSSTLHPNLKMHKKPTFPQNFTVSNLNKNNTTLTQLPIFFTNPASGIIYAITEVGKVQENAAYANETRIPIYVTKEQYDRDLFLLRKYFEHRCRKNAVKSFQVPHANHTQSISTVSVTSNSTVAPHILRLKQPVAQTIFKQPATQKVPATMHKPPPLIFQTEGTVKDHLTLPPKREKNKKHKTAKRKRKKSQKRPGRKPITHTLNQLPTFPQIVLGTRPTDKPSDIYEKLPTQLEKPADGTSETIFSNSLTIPAKYHSLSPLSSKTDNAVDFSSTDLPHNIKRRSVSNVREFQNELLFSPNRSALSWSPTAEKDFKPIPNESINLTLKPTHAYQHDAAKTIGYASRKLLDTQITNITLKNPEPDLTLESQQTKATPNITIVVPRPTAKVLETTLNLATARSAQKPTPSRSKKFKLTNQKPTKRKPVPSDSDYDYFGFDTDGDDDDDDEYENEHGDYYHSTKYSTAGSPLATTQADNDYLQDDISLNGSSAEEGADYGAMDVDAATSHHQEKTSMHDSQEISNSKNTPGKKRIRRRPSSSSSNSIEEYDDDDYAVDADSGFGGFFRLIFYPVQTLMSRLIDSFGGEKDSSVEVAQAMPTYTLYHNGNNRQEEYSDEANDEQTNSLSSWLSSWFGFNRRTKKIGSTTIAPPVVTTEEPSWFSSWFNYADSKTTTEASYEDYDDDKWFFGWFDSNPKTKKHRLTTTTTTAPTPQVPILTIVDPMHNPQNWIGILAHHIINATSTSTHNPLFEAFTRATTTTTTVDPDIPRKITYDKYQIWRLKPQDAGQVKTLEEYKNSDEGSKLQWLKGPSLRGHNDVLVSPKMIIDFQGTLQFESIAHEVLIFDVGKVIAYEKSKEHYIYTTTHRPNKQSTKRNQQMTMSWNKYYEYDDIVRYLESMRFRYPQIIELMHIGRSYEGRPLIIVKIEAKQMTASPTNNTSINRKKLKFKKKSGQANAVFIEAGVHGMEWIAPATANWMINELVRIMKSNNFDIEQDFIKNTTWYILPVLNPDGYVYSHEFDRFWKKSRSRYVSRPGGIITSAITWLQQKKTPEKVCYGVNLDRNWKYQWGRRGSSNSPCNEAYAGPLPFSEPETNALSRFLIDNGKQIKLYISLQAYGQILSYPVKANESFNSDHMDDFLDVAMVGTDWLRKRGSKSRYKIDSTSDLIENRSGCSDAFAAYEVGVPFSYTLQLADNGVHGYLLPSSSIEPTARDAFEIITAMIDYI